MQGYPVRSLFSYQFAGLNEQGIPQVINENGEVVTSDVNFQSFDATHLVYEGPTDPTITGGFGNTVSWKNFRLNVFLTYSFGNKIRLDPVFKYSYDDMQALPREFKNRWVTPGDEMYTTIPAIATYRQYVADSQLSRAYNAYNYSTERIADGGFVRLKEISLTYDLPESFLKKIRFSSASVKVQATNLCLLYADKKLNGQIRNSSTQVVWQLLTRSSSHSLFVSACRIVKQINRQQNYEIAKIIIYRCCWIGITHIVQRFS